MENKSSSIGHVGEHLALLGIGLGVLFWFLESAIHVRIFQQGRLPQQILAPDTHELWMRSLVVLLVIAFGFYGQFLINRRRQAEGALRASEAWLSTTLHSIGDAVIATDDTGRVKLMNPVAQALTGWSMAQALGRPLTDIFDIVNEQTGRPAENPVERVLREGVVVGLANHTVLIARDGTRRPIDDSGAPIRDAAGRIIGTVLIFRDISERKQIEQILRQEKLKLEDVTRFANCGLLLLDDQTRIVFANRLAQEWFGTFDEIKGRHCWEIFHAYDPQIECPVRQVLQTGKTVQSDIFQERVKGEERTFYVIASPVKDGKGKVGQVSAVIIDLTERKRMEEALLESERRFKALFDQASDYILVLDPRPEDGPMIVDVNDSACKMHGYTRDELIGKPITFLGDEETKKHTAERTRQLMSGETLTFEATHVRKDGSTFPVQVSSRLIRIGGETSYIYSIQRDITERKRAEKELAEYHDHLEELVAKRTRQLEASQAQLRQAERLASVGTLAAGIAHEINNPVGAIRLAAENALKLRSEPNGHDITERALTRIVDNSEQCGRIVRSILQFARQEPTDKWACDLNQMVERAVELTRRYAAQRGARLAVEYAEGLPSVWANPIGIEQVLANLIRNAIEAGGEGVLVLVRTEAGAERACVMVQDTGRGLTQEQTKRLFDPFYTTRREDGGTGLGLSVVHGIISEHDGTIDVQSEPGQGTTVTVELPLAQD